MNGRSAGGVEGRFINTSVNSKQLKPKVMSCAINIYCNVHNLKTKSSINIKSQIINI